MQRLGDNNPRYYDGSVGGLHPLFDEMRQAGSAQGRYNYGYAAGKADAKEIIDNLKRDPSNNIVETIKVITHSMGGAYGKGFVAALKAYIKTLPLEQQKQIKITLVADFDPYQAGDMEADPNIYTQQFWHDGGLLGLADEVQEGVDEDNSQTGRHWISTFFNDISQLREGTYEWDNNKNEWVCTSCQ